MLFKARKIRVAFFVYPSNPFRRDVFYMVSAIIYYCRRTYKTNSTKWPGFRLASEVMVSKRVCITHENFSGKSIAKYAGPIDYLQTKTYYFIIRYVSLDVYVRLRNVCNCNWTSIPFENKKHH